MTPDPLAALRQPIAPLEPRSAFAAELRARLARALGGTPNTAPTIGGHMTSPTPVAIRAHGVTPYLSVQDARRAIAFYRDVFGATGPEPLVVQPDGRIGHAEMRIGGSTIMFADEFPEIGFLGPLARGGTPVQLVVQVDDADAVVGRALAAGAELVRPVADRPYGVRSGQIADPFGHRWDVSAPLSATPGGLPGA